MKKKRNCILTFFRIKRFQELNFMFSAKYIYAVFCIRISAN